MSSKIKFGQSYKNATERYSVSDGFVRRNVTQGKALNDHCD